MYFAAVVTLVGCGGKSGGGDDGGTSTTAVNTVPRFAYVADGDNGTVSVYAVDATSGQLRHRGYALAGTSPVFVAIHPNDRFVYAVNFGSNRVSAYRIDATTGALAEVVGSPFVTRLNPTSMAFHPSGGFAYVTNSSDSSVSAYAVDTATGALAQIDADPATPGVQHFAAGSGPENVVVDPSGRFAYVANLFSNTVSAYTIDTTTGALSRIDADGATPGIQDFSTGGTFPRSLGIGPNGSFLYVVNSGTTTIASFGIGATGALTALPGGPLAASMPSARTLTLDAGGRYVYLAHSSGFVSVYSVNADGTLTAVPGSIVYAGDIAVSITLDPSGRFTYLGLTNVDRISAFTVDAGSGLLARGALPSDVVTRDGPAHMAITKGTAAVTYKPKFAYVANAGSDDVSGYSVSATSGALTALATGPFAAGDGPNAVAVDPSGRFAYAANRNVGTVSVYQVNATTGELTAGTAVSAGTNPQSISIDPSGRFVYVANVGSSNVSGYRIDDTSGALTEVAGSPFAAISGATAVAVDRSGRFVYATNYFNNSVSAYQIDATNGVLTPIDADAATPGVQGFPAGSGPNSISVDASGQFVYVANLLDDTITAYRLNTASGALARIDTDAGTPGTQDMSVPNARPVSITTDPSGRFAYIATACGNIWALGIDLASGVLSRLDSTPGGLCFASANAPNLSIVDPSGRFLYLGDYASASGIPAYTIGATGEVTGMVGSPFVSGSAPRSVAITASIE
jgi:6-phosphogluconolactonase (cycloisomerase 2 family)